DVEPDVEAVGEAVEEAREIAAGRIVLAAEAADLLGQLLLPLPARPFGENADVGVVPDAVGADAAADDVVVEVGDDVPALRLGMGRDDLGAVQALLLAGVE